MIIITICARIGLKGHGSTELVIGDKIELITELITGQVKLGALPGLSHLCLALPCPAMLCLARPYKVVPCFELPHFAFLYSDRLG